MIVRYMRSLRNINTFIILCDFQSILLYVCVLVHMYSDEYFDNAVQRIQGVSHILYFVCCITNALVSVCIIKFFFFTNQTYISCIIKIIHVSATFLKVVLFLPCLII
jgi:hypothetical protein